MAEQLKAGPMIVEKQTVFEVRSCGAPTRGAGGYDTCALTQRQFSRILQSWRAELTRYLGLGA